jgi:hypothetical protein
MKLILLFLTLLSASSALYPQQWQNASDWRLYKFTTSQGRQFSRDSLHFYGYHPLSIDSLQYYLHGATLIPSEKTTGAAWMGDYWASCKLNDTLKIIRISRYGGFFVDLDSDHYYEIPLSFRASWHEYINRQYLAFRNSDSPN